MNARTWEGAQIVLLDTDLPRPARRARIAAGACTKCALRQARPGLKTCAQCVSDGNVAREARRVEEAGGKVFLIVASKGPRWQGPTLLEASEDNTEGVFRRDVDCARLTACERDWTDRANASGDIGTQAQCPAVCACYSNRWRRVL